MKTPLLILLFVLIPLFLITICQALPNDANNKIDFTYPTAATNFSQQNVSHAATADYATTSGSADTWDGLDTPADINTGDLTDDDTYVEVAGDTMTGDLELLNAGDNTAITIHGGDTNTNASLIFEEVDLDRWRLFLDGLDNNFYLWNDWSNTPTWMANLVTNSITFNGSLLPWTTLMYDLGSGANRWRWLYVQNISSDYGDFAYDVNIDGDLQVDCNINVTNMTIKNMWVVNTIASGNITAGEYFIGDGSQLTGIEHNNLEGLQGGGGEGTEYYHLNLNVWDMATSFLDTAGFNDNTLEIGSGISLSFDNGNVTTECITLSDGEPYCTFATTYYNATQSQAVAGTINGGTLTQTQHPDGNYDGVTFNFSEEVGTPGLDLRINFTGVDSFNKGYIRYKTSSLSGDYPAIQLWDYDSGEWEGGYGFLSETELFLQYTNDVLDSSSHIQDGVIQMRLYKLVNGNTQNHYYVDMLAVVDGYATPSGNVDLTPYWRYDDNDEDRNFLTNGNISAGWLFVDNVNITSNITIGDTTKFTGSNVTEFVRDGVLGLELS